MSDLVKRLRGFPPNVHATMTEAADRIAEMEAALRNIEDEATALQARVAKLKRLVEILMDSDPWDYRASDAVTVLDVWRKEARAALEGGKDEAAPSP